MAQPVPGKATSSEGGGGGATRPVVHMEGPRRLCPSRITLGVNLVPASTIWLEPLGLSGDRLAEREKTCDTVLELIETED